MQIFPESKISKARPKFVELQEFLSLRTTVKYVKLNDPKVEAYSELSRKSLEKFEKCSETFVWPSNNTRTIFGKLRSRNCKKFLERKKSCSEGEKLPKRFRASLGKPQLYPAFWVAEKRYSKKIGYSVHILIFFPGSPFTVCPKFVQETSDQTQPARRTRKALWMGNIPVYVDLARSVIARQQVKCSNFMIP